MDLTPDQYTVVHTTFAVERIYPVPAARVFTAFSNPVSKRRWFIEGEGWEIESFTMDFRVGGHERSRFRFEGGALVSNDTIYLDIVPERRIVFAYTMTVSDRRISASLATVELTASSNGTRLVYTEQGAFFDGVDAPVAREAGCRELLEKLGEELQTYGRTTMYMEGQHE